MEGNFNSGGDTKVFLKVILIISVVLFVLIVTLAFAGHITNDTPPSRESGTAAESGFRPVTDRIIFGESSPPPAETAPPEIHPAEPDSTAAGITETVSDETNPADTIPDKTPAGETTAPGIPEKNPAAPPLSISKTSPAILGETDDMGQEYIDDIIFLGDSTTYGLWRFRLLKDGRNTNQVWTGTEGYLLLDQAHKRQILYPDTGETITIAEAAGRKEPKMMVITLGVNGVAMMNEMQFKSEYKKVINAISDASPATVILLQSIFPVAATYNKLQSINNEIIDAANGWIIEIAEELGLRYLDTASILKDETGFMIPDYDTDGIHLSEATLKLVLNYIRTHGYVVDDENEAANQ